MSSARHKIKDFRFLILAMICAELAIQIQSVIVGWQVYEIKRDPLYLGIIGLVEAVPALTMALLSGHIIDRSNPLKILKNVLALMLLSAILLLAASNQVQTNTRYALLGIYLAVFLSGLARAFHGPSIEVLVPRLVARESFNVTSAWTTSALHMAYIVGPAVGGFLYAWKGAHGPYTLNCVLIVAGLIFISFIGYIHVPPARITEAKETALTSVMAGFNYVRKHELLLSALTLDMFAVLFGGVTALLPIFADKILHVGPTGLGVLRAAPAVGALITSSLLIRFPVSRAAGKKLLFSVSGFGVCIVAFGLSKNFLFSICMLGLTGAFDSVSMVVRSAMVRLCSPENMRGRIGAVNSIFIGSSSEIGAFESGVTAQLLGTIPSVVLGGCLTLVTVIITAALWPRLRKMNLSDL